ncbi:MAG TPA: DUF3147 family protein [Syntrophorhabdaceae bacterium]|nr:DUF3147 family protein [Syntrophorhabdaceae bacterium]
MDKVFLIKLFLSFIIGSVWVTGSTVLAERYGTKIGGIVTGLPSTILFGLFFIAWTQSVRVAVEATEIVPFVGGINSLFLVVYILLVRYNFWLALAGAILVWFLLSFVLVFFGINDFKISIFTYILLFSISYYIVEKKLKIKSEMGKDISFTFSMFLVRGVISGFIITLTVFLTKIGGPLIGGLFTMFPAMFLGTLLITYFSHGPSFSSAVMKSSMIGAISVVVYGITARFVFIPFGLWLGTIISLVVSYLFAFLIHKTAMGKIA